PSAKRSRPFCSVESIMVWHAACPAGPSLFSRLGGPFVSTPSTAEKERQQSFAETALRLSGKSDDEARRTGAVDTADEQVESLFAARFQTPNSPIHKAVWESEVPLDLFQPAQLPASLPCDAAMERCVAIIRRRRETDTLFDANGKISAETIDELAQ